jgi:hypothetical protein
MVTRAHKRQLGAVFADRQDAVAAAHELGDAGFATGDLADRAARDDCAYDWDSGAVFARSIREGVLVGIPLAAGLLTTLVIIAVGHRAPTIAEITAGGLPRGARRRAGRRAGRTPDRCRAKMGGCAAAFPCRAHRDRRYPSHGEEHPRAAPRARRRARRRRSELRLPGCRLERGRCPVSPRRAWEATPPHAQQLCGRADLHQPSASRSRRQPLGRRRSRRPSRPSARRTQAWQPSSGRPPLTPTALPPRSEVLRSPDDSRKANTVEDGAVLKTCWWPYRDGI